MVHRMLRRENFEMREAILSRYRAKYHTSDFRRLRKNMTSYGSLELSAPKKQPSFGAKVVFSTKFMHFLGHKPLPL
jgi:hypothetical protein